MKEPKYFAKLRVVVDQLQDIRFELDTILERVRNTEKQTSLDEAKLFVEDAQTAVERVLGV